MTRNVAGTWGGLVLITLGLVAMCFAQLNMSTQMDVADREQTAGNLFELGLLPLGVLGLTVLAGGVVVVAMSVRQRPPAEEGGSTDGDVPLHARHPYGA